MRWFKPRRALTADPDALGMDMQMACATLMRRALRTGEADTGMSITMFGCSLRDEPYGDWEFTARRVVIPKDIAP